MRRTLLVAFLAAVCAAVVLAPAASAAKFAITGLSVSSLGPAGDTCELSVTLTYTGKAPRGAGVNLQWWTDGAVAATAGAGSVQTSGSTASYFVYTPNIQSGISSFDAFVINNKSGRTVAQSGTTSPAFTSTAGTCPASGTDLGSWARPS